MKVHGSTAVVTGGQRGLGKALVDELIKRGAFLVYATAREPAGSQHPRVINVALDVTRAKSIAALAIRASEANIVINNAGISGGRPSPLNSDMRDVRRVFETNYFGAVAVARAFAPVLARNGGGALVNILSVMSWLAGKGAYGDSKAALWAATNSLRLELARQNTLVTGVHAGYIDTDMVRTLDVDKIAPAAAAATILDGLENDQNEVLVDDFTREVKAALSGPVERLKIR
ncbi:SDR family oxidoreductase [Mycobacterium sp. NPDC048908]|uniref:SDR family oxidoreductase n=1 Tax=Mycobacterium sp. NPDC048908 TaxID=3364292 RepID=UPI0037218B14